VKAGPQFSSDLRSKDYGLAVHFHFRFQIFDFRLERRHGSAGNRPSVHDIPETELALKKQPAPQTPAEAAALKAAQRERNLTPRPAPQTGSHL
jgi:hypothetical protein